MKDSRSLFQLCIQMLKTTIKLTIAVIKKLTKVTELTTKQARIGTAQETGPAALNR